MSGAAALLAIETAFAEVSIALKVGDRVLEPRDGLARARGSGLHEALADVLDRAGVRLDDLDAILVDRGPGSYTGLRIGLSIANTLRLLHDKPVESLYSTDVVAWLGRERLAQGQEAWVALDARRLHWSVARYRRGEAGVERLEPPRVIETADCARLLAGQPVVLAVGDEVPGAVETFRVRSPAAADLFALRGMAEGPGPATPLYPMPAVERR